MEYDYSSLSSLDNVVAVSTPEFFGTETHGAGMMRFASIDEVLKVLRPDQSVQCMHPDRLATQARAFVDHFPGDALYAVKANPDPYVLQHLHAAGINHFDVASLNEVKLVRGLFPDAHLAFMHPIKSRTAIKSAYFDYGVRDFVIDTFEELHKVLEETKVAADLTIIVRIDMPKGSAAYSLAGKFGCSPAVAVSLLRDVDKVAHKTGVSFHVGSQSTDPQSYADAIRKAGEIVRQSGVELDVFDVGGGFPIANLGMDVPPLMAFFDVIRHEIAGLELPPTCAIWSEPGRALSGTATTLLVKVELRKDDALYINDGTFGNMFEVAAGKWQNTVRLLRLPRPPRRSRKAASKNMAPFRFFGPTCDSVDYMPGPFMLPEDICEGDWIALQGMGSYMAASQSSFNGFYSDLQVEITGDQPIASKRRAVRLNLVKA